MCLLVLDCWAGHSLKTTNLQRALKHTFRNAQEGTNLPLKERWPQKSILSILSHQRHGIEFSAAEVTNKMIPQQQRAKEAKREPWIPLKREPYDVLLNLHSETVALSAGPAIEKNPLLTWNWKEKWSKVQITVHLLLWLKYMTGPLSVPWSRNLKYYVNIRTASLLDVDFSISVWKNGL